MKITNFGHQRIITITVVDLLSSSKKPKIGQIHNSFYKEVGSTRKSLLKHTPSMTPVSSKQYADDVSLLMVLIDTNPLFWSSTTTSFSFSKFLSQVNPNDNVLSFLNSILLLNQLNQVVVIATGFNSCDYIYDSSLGHTNQRAETLLQKLEEFVIKDEALNKEDSVDGIGSSLLSGSLSMALCCILLIT
ncbi:hypothetical protein Ccrd_018683 [Cynara cardunculus var. scolymus]|uniref:General transcription and DNA repair factor IIH subunit TFB4 n=1 Tax=Cynara cardunculus var. scolymus TaxID=59895 RepID=A0A103Y5Q5_CYNCS|nr:hypothetical protein Ccrd_018683 [Cynara cardunculus var. scolymus]